MARGLDATARVFTPARSVEQRKRDRLGLVAARVDARNGLDAAADDPVAGYRYKAKRAGAPQPRARSAATQAAGGRPAVRYESLWRSPRNRQQGPRCTAYGFLTGLHCRPTLWRPYPATDPVAFYEGNQAIDRAAGRVFSEGATTLAACENARAHGFIGAYDWEYEADVVLDALARREGTWIAGTEWLDFMFDRTRDAKGRMVIESPPPDSPKWTRSAGGHLYALNGLEDDLLRIPQTWGDGDYWLPVAVFRVLLEQRDGEAVFPRELPPPRAVAAPAPVLTHGIPSE